MVGLQFLFLEPYVPYALIYAVLMNSNPDDPLNKGLSLASRKYIEGTDIRCRQ